MPRDPAIFLHSSVVAAKSPLTSSEMHSGSHHSGAAGVVKSSFFFVVDVDVSPAATLLPLSTAAAVTSLCCVVVVVVSRPLLEACFAPVLYLLKPPFEICVCEAHAQGSLER